MTVSTTALQPRMRHGRPSDEGELIALLQMAWPQELGKHFQDDPWFIWEQFRIVEINEQIVSMLKIYRRELAWGDSSIVIGGIGDVVTHPDHRGRGYAAMTIQDAVQYMRKSAYDASLLFSDLASFYRRYGWESVSQPMLQIAVAQVKNTGGDAYAMQAFDIDAHLFDVMAIYDAFNRGRFGVMVRSVEYWRAQIDGKNRLPHTFFVATDGSRVVAYVRGQYVKDKASIEEYGCRPGHEQALIDLLSHSLKVAAEMGSDTLEVAATRDDIIDAAVRRMGIGRRWVLFQSTMLQLFKHEPMPSTAEGCLAGCGDGEIKGVNQFFYWPTDRF